MPKLGERTDIARCVLRVFQGGEKSAMSNEQIFPVSDEIADSAWIDNDTYLAMYQASVDDPEAFWGEHGKRIDWIKPYTKVRDVDYRGDVRIRWYYDGTLNVSYLCGPAPESRGTRRPFSGRRRPFGLSGYYLSRTS